MIKPNKYLFEEIQTDPSYLISHLGIPDSADGVDVVRESCCGYGQGNPARGSPGRGRMGPSSRPGHGRAFEDGAAQGAQRGRIGPAWRAALVEDWTQSSRIHDIALS